MHKMSCRDGMVRRAGSNRKDPQEANTTDALTEEDYEKMKKFRTTRGRHLTIYCKEISNVVCFSERDSVAICSCTTSLYLSC